MPLREIADYRKSYKAGLLQAKAFRILKNRTNSALKPFDLNATDWGILGLLVEAPDGLKLKDVAREMGVKPPYVTRSMQSLKERGYIALASQAEDARTKVATITTEGKTFVQKTEPVVMKTILDTLKSAGTRNVLGYVLTLAAVVRSGNQSDFESTDLDHMQ